jgi:broad specificity phosphatase PhoE
MIRISLRDVLLLAALAVSFHCAVPEAAAPRASEAAPVQDDTRPETRGQANQVTTLFIIRHADRAGTADALSPAGDTRARILVHAFGKSGLSGIYTSNTVRARATAAHLATALGITPVERAPNDVAGLLQDVLAHHRGKAVLIVGHSNTVPEIIAAAGGPSMATIPENEFDNLFVLEVTGSGPPTLVNLQYGAPSP